MSSKAELSVLSTSPEGTHIVLKEAHWPFGETGKSGTCVSMLWACPASGEILGMGF